MNGVPINNQGAQGPRFDPIENHDVGGGNVALEEAQPRPQKRSMQTIGGLEFRKRPNLKRFLSQSPKTNIRHFKEWKSQRALKHSMRSNLTKPLAQQKTASAVIADVAGRKDGKGVMKGRHIALANQGGNVGMSANDVKAMTYHRNIGESGTNIGFFKIESENTVSHEARGVGISENSSFAPRAVLSSKLDKALGLNVLSHDQYAIHREEKGVISAKTEGNSLIAERLFTPVDTTGYDENDIATMLESSTNRRTADGGIERYSGSVLNTSINFAEPQTQKGLSDLQVMDFITGQVDRHPGNIFVSNDGTVTGIDNDLAFGSKNEALGGPNQFGLPDLIDQSTAEAILSMTDETFRELIGEQDPEFGGLSEQEMGAALLRFFATQEVLQQRSDQGDLVTEWNADTFERTVSGNATMSYTNRATIMVEEQHSNAMRGLDQVIEEGQAEETREILTGLDDLITDVNSMFDDSDIADLIGGLKSMSDGSG